MIGQTISHYKILEKLGEGGMGVVYKAHDIKLDRDVAIKFLPGHLAANAVDRERFTIEARAAAALNHPHIATIHSIEEVDGETFFVMEYIDGHELKNRIRSAPLSVDEVVEISKQIVEGLQAAHRKGVVHRDIKSSNIMLTADGGVKIMDFGLAKVRGGSQITKVGSTVGTVAYMSPEQIRGETVNQQTDIWASGVVLYEMLAGRIPFHGDYDQAIVYRILNEDPESLVSLRPDLPPEVERIVKKALMKDQSQRYQHVDEMLIDLRNVKSGVAASAQRRDVHTRRKRSPALLVLATACLLVLFAALVLYLLQSFRNTPPDLAQKKPVNRQLRQLTFAEGLEEFPSWSSDDKQLAYTKEVDGHKKVFLRNLASGEDIQLTKGTMDDIQPAWSPNGKAILFVRSHQSNGKMEPGDVFGQLDGGDIWVVDLATRSEVKMIDNAFSPSSSPDGDRIACDASWAGPRRIWVVDSRGRNPVQVSTDSSEAVGHVLPRWSPDGTRLVFQNIERTKFDLKIINVDTKQTKWLTNDLFRDVNPTWSTAGIFFSSDRGGGVNIWRIGLLPDGQPAGRPEQVTMGPGQDVQISSSFDGKRLVFSILKINADVWRMPISSQTGVPTGEPEPVIHTTREDSRGAWSADGAMVAFNSDRSGDMNIWIYSVVDKSARQLTKGSGGDYQPNWSPDGKWIAFFSTRAGNTDIWSINVSTGELKQITVSGYLEINPFFSPDGEYIAYQSDAGGRLEPWVMTKDGKDQRKLAEVPVLGHFMRWSPDASSLLFRSPSLSQPGIWSARRTGGEAKFFCIVQGGSHISFSPRFDRIMDVVGHKELWVSPTSGAVPTKIFTFPDPDVRIDYPIWSADGKWVLFDRVQPQGGDIWSLENIE